MADLTPAHRGYEYQDLLVACRLVDMLLDTVTEAHVDKKLVENDRFDDLTVKDASGRWERSQFKGSPQNYLCDTGRVVIKAEVAGCDAVVPVRVELVRSDDLGCQVLHLLFVTLMPVGYLPVSSSARTRSPGRVGVARMGSRITCW